MIGEAAFERPALRSEDDKFRFKSNFFCGQPAMAGNKRKGLDYRIERYSPDSVPGKKRFMGTQCTGTNFKCS